MLYHSEIGWALKTCHLPPQTYNAQEICMEISLKWQFANKLQLASMWVLAPRSTYAQPSAQRPINTSGNFLGTHLGGGDKFSRHFRQFHALLVFSQKKNLTNQPT